MELPNRLKPIVYYFSQEDVRGEPSPPIRDMIQKGHDQLKNMNDEDKQWIGFRLYLIKDKPLDPIPGAWGPLHGAHVFRSYCNQYNYSPPGYTFAHDQVERLMEQVYEISRCPRPVDRLDLYLAFLDSFAWSASALPARNFGRLITLVRKAYDTERAMVKGGMLVMEGRTHVIIPWKDFEDDEETDEDEDDAI